ncbi:MAG: hypothetical protein NC210_08920, partial [[Clostridium] fimetarium]|nr:hypothetical protein [[Clostridium] fimetarium]
KGTTVFETVPIDHSGIFPLVCFGDSRRKLPPTDAPLTGRNRFCAAKVRFFPGFEKLSARFFQIRR